MNNLLFIDGIFYVGGNFTLADAIRPLPVNNIAAYSAPNESWHSLSAGVNGPVTKINTLLVNVTMGKPEAVIVINGDFDLLLEFGSNNAIDTDGLGVWVPSAQNWLNNIPAAHPAFVGQLRASTSTLQTKITSNYFTGSIASYGLSAEGVIMLSNKGFEGFDIKMAYGPTTNSINSGLFYEKGDRNVIVLGGQFKFRGPMILFCIISLSSTDQTGIASRVHSTYPSMAR